MGGGAWPFLVGGVICLVNSDNERDLILLNSRTSLSKIRLISMGQLTDGGDGASCFLSRCFLSLRLNLILDYQLSLSLLGRGVIPFGWWGGIDV